MNKNNFKYDADADILWYSIKEGVEDLYEELAPGFVFEYDKDKNLIGVEIQNYSRLYDFKVKEYSDSEVVSPEVNITGGKFAGSFSFV